MSTEPRDPAPPPPYLSNTSSLEEWFEAGKQRTMFSDEINEPTKQEAVRRWVLLLETTTEEQGTGTLHVVHMGKAGFCCLGIACQALGLTPIPSTCITAESSIFYQYDGSLTLLPHEAKDSLALPFSAGKFRPVLWTTAIPVDTYPAENLIALNDTTRATFKQIAAFIRGVYFNQTGKKL